MSTIRPPPRKLVNGISWSDSRKLTTPVSEFSYTGKISPKLEARGGYIFYRYSGPASLDMSFDGIARTNTGGTTDAPYAVSLSTRANVTEPNHVIDQGFTYKVREWWSVLLDYRYSRFTVDSNAQFRSVTGLVVNDGRFLQPMAYRHPHGGFQHDVYPDIVFVGANWYPLHEERCRVPGRRHRRSDRGPSALRPSGPSRASTISRPRC